MSIDYLDWDEDDSLRRARSFAKDKEEHTLTSLLTRQATESEERDEKEWGSMLLSSIDTSSRPLQCLVVVFVFVTVHK